MLACKPAITDVGSFNVVVDRDEMTCVTQEVGFNGVGAIELRTRQLLHPRRKRDGQPARWIDITPKYRRYGIRAPGYHASMTPATFGNQGISTGPLVSRTTIVRGLAAATAAISAS